MPMITAFHATIDNERKIRDHWTTETNWKGENIDAPFNKAYDCSFKNGTVTVSGAMGGVSRKPLMRHSLEFTVYENGKIKIHLLGKIRPDAYWIPRLGFEFTIPEENAAFSYYGRGPVECYCDMHHAMPVGLYTSTAADEYVPYPRPQEHGNHFDTKSLTIGSLTFRAEKTMEVCVSHYSIAQLDKAKHTDELTPDKVTHLRIDYRHSGVGSAACGPELAEKHRICERNP